MPKYILLVLLLIASTTHATRLGPNDISLLLPLPETAAEDKLWRADQAGGYGELLPLELYRHLPRIAFETAEDTYPKLRVISMRLDPCFPPKPPRQGCLPQVRLVWQPVEPDQNGRLRTIDAAAHTFYDLEVDEFRRLKEELEAVKLSGQEDEVLRIQPQLEREGWSGPYARRVLPLILAHLGRERLSEIATMQLAGGENVWIFSHASVTGGQLATLPIPRVPRPMQAFMNTPAPWAPTYFNKARAVPEPEGADTIVLLFRDSREFGPAEEVMVTDAVMAAYRIENPETHTARSMDCVTCHSAQIARVWAEARFPWLGLNQRANGVRYDSRFSLVNSSPSPGDTRVLRAFGYFGRTPAISQRTVNETAAVLERLYSGF